MILDNALSKSLIVSDKLKKMLNYVKPFTRRYVFNADASHKQGRFGHHYIDIVCRNASQAVKPFPNTYIEIDHHALVRGRGEEPATDSVQKIGFWWTQYGHCFVVEGNEKQAEFTPFIYAQHGTHDGDQLLNLYGTQQIKSDDPEDDIYTYDAFKTALMCGHMNKAMREGMSGISNMLTDLYEVGMTMEHIPQEILQMYFSEGVGTFKYGITALMLLDERSKRRLVPVAASRKIVKCKIRATPAHHMVTIDLDVPYIRNVYADAVGHRVTPMEHDVSEHWVTYDTANQCKHDWQPFYSEDSAKRDAKAGHEKPLRREFCTLCGGRRTRKPNYISGDPKKGSTVGTKTYRVIASNEKGSK